MDTLLLRHAHDNGVQVLQGVKVQDVLFEGDRAVGLRAKVATDGSGTCTRGSSWTPPAAGPCWRTS
jgi:glycerol-3-phosphate dehydrogenase